MDIESWKEREAKIDESVEREREWCGQVGSKLNCYYKGLKNISLYFQTPG